MIVRVGRRGYVCASSLAAAAQRRDAALDRVRVARGAADDRRTPSSRTRRGAPFASRRCTVRSRSCCSASRTAPTCARSRWNGCASCDDAAARTRRDVRVRHDQRRRRARHAGRDEGVPREVPRGVHRAHRCRRIASTPIAEQFCRVVLPRRASSRTASYDVAHSPQIFVLDAAGKLRAELFGASIESMTAVALGLLSER